jgi:Cu-Zn family superoxide dismutase
LAPSPTALPASTPVAAATPIAGGRVFALSGGGGFPEGIAYDAGSGDFYTGSAVDGTIYRGNVRSGDIGALLPGRPGLVAFGLALDGRGHLFVAGGDTGFVAVYDVASRRLLAEFSNGLAPNTFLNDVAITPDGDAYITDSFNPILWRIPATALASAVATPGAAPAAGPLQIFLDLSGNPLFLSAGFNANGIVETPDGAYLLVVRSNTGALYRIDIGSGEVRQVDLGGAVLSGGSGLALDGQTLFVITGETAGTGDAITPVTLAADFASGVVGASVTDPTFAAPTSLARFDGCALVVNSQLDRIDADPSLPFTVSSVPVPVTGGATPVAPGAC